MAEWIEFNVIGYNDDVNSMSVRVYLIRSVLKTGDKSCDVCLDDEQGKCYNVAESYEEVMQKIREAEGPVAIPVAEHFTTDEYDYMRATLENFGGDSLLNRKVTNKLKEILKEDKKCLTGMN